jgi:hypothetical protein
VLARRPGRQGTPTINGGDEGGGAALHGGSVRAKCNVSGHQSGLSSLRGGLSGRRDVSAHGDLGAGSADLPEEGTRTLRTRRYGLSTA